MKKLFLILASCAVLSIAANAQPKDDSWKTRMQSEKIAFITNEVELTPEEAQVFWPVYNKQEKLRGEAMKAVRDSYRELSEALGEGDSSKKIEKAVGKAIDKYLEALENSKSLDAAAIAEYRKVLSEEKVGKLLVAEEKFRRTQIRRLHEGCPGAPGASGSHGGFGNHGGHGNHDGHGGRGNFGRVPDEHGPAPMPKK